MFEQATLSNGPAAKRVWTTCLGFTGQALVVLFLILAPMIWPDVLPQARAYVNIIGPVAPPPPPPPPGTVAVQPQNTQRRGRTLFDPARFTQPPRVPDAVLALDEPPSLALAGPGFDGPGLPGPISNNGPGVIGGVDYSRLVAPPPPPPVPIAPKPPETPTRVIQTSQLDQAQILRRIEPVYPEMAIRMRVEGTVELRGIVGTDGRIRELKVLRGHPLLVKAAVDAVSQWIYKPTRLSGQPVEVDAPILVTFRLH